jgi:integrase
MPTIKLTKRTIDAIAPASAGQLLYRDADLPGFGLRVGTRTKVFFAEGQVRRRTVRVTLGKYGPVTPERARKLAMRALSDMAGGHDPNEADRLKRAQAITLQEAFDAFFKGRPILSPKTVPNYRRTIDFYLKDWAGRPCADISRTMVLDRHRRIAEDNGAVTANNVMRHLRSVYNYTSATAGELPTNPVSILTQSRSWSVERRRRTLIPMHGLPRWHRAVMAEEEHARDFLLVALFTGMRRSEIAGLRWEHVGLEARVLTVPLTKNGEPLILPLSTHLYDLLLARRDVDPEGDWVFPGVGATGHIVEVKSFVGRVAKASGFKFTLHDLRRTFVTIAESLDIPAYALKRLLNHRTDSDVTGGYIVMDVERLRAPVERVAARILELAQANDIPFRQAA